MNTRVKAHALFWAVLSGGVAADLLSKHFVFRWLSDLPGNVCDAWPGVFRFSMRMNTGGPFSLFRGHNHLLLGFAIFALGVVVYLYLSAARRGATLGLVALGLIAAGAVGNNLFDRFVLGYVRDFLDVTLIHYPVFNVADILITVGAGLLIIDLLRGRTPRVAATERSREAGA